MSQAVLNEFLTHTVIQPFIQHGQSKETLQSTLDKSNGLHAHHIILSFLHQGKRIHIELIRSDGLLPSTHFLRYQNERKNAGHVVVNFTKTDGYIRGEENSKVALSTCDGQLTGIIYYGQEMYSIYPHIDGSGRLLDNHYLLNHADLKHKNETFVHNTNKDNYKYESEYEEVQNKFHQRRRRDEEDYLIHRPYNANPTSSYVELVLVVDYNLYNSFNQDIKEVHRYCKDLVNVMNVLYEPLNIFLALVGVVIWNKSNEIEITSNATDTLWKFLSYRSKELAITYPNDFALLLTENKYKDVNNYTILGQAFYATICTSTHSGGIVAQQSKTLAEVATTMAHEMGHSLGMNDEYDNCICPDEACIMNGMSKGFNPVRWSSCSIQSLNTSFSKEITDCLRNKPKKLFESPDCGNGFVEPWEECDCGLPDYCENPCCNAHTCKLNSGALCATGECCDLETCELQLAGDPCRKAENECDLPEYCTGESEYCPNDFYRRDAEPCDGGQAYCFHGNCRSHDHQCRIMRGPHATNSEPCYEQNKGGDRLGHCGYNRPGNSFVSCTDENIMCGKLHCTNGNGTLIIGNDFSTNVSEFSAFDHLYNLVDCFGAEVDIGSQFLDRGLTPNGAKCGVNRMCVNQSCVSIEEILEADCPENCNNNGICNSSGHCHCDLGFGGESCSTTGYGGSQDSGPASSVNRTCRQFQYLYLLFLLIIPLVAIFWFVLFKTRDSAKAEEVPSATDPKSAC
ncbi:zinc metalloproteinase-disintegrin-like atrolysin-A [Drosophila willistoni]|uniref:zinc metalloproteinase-disintegrin-like atrolysin-A n=1 Tax=Drosophila willistoni TaxID=7260 RepID=UPI000C26D776|nr:zinc metalloproteinase-disintegrin-like atrolysin-A [Drosophila willistoni]